MKILWLTNIPSPYRVDFFNELGKQCNLTVLFERSNSAERDKSWMDYKFNTFNGVIMKGINIGVDKAITLSFIKFLKINEYNHVVISNPLTPTGILAIEYLRLNRINYSIEGDGAFANNVKSIKEYFKKHILKGAYRYFSTADAHDYYYLKYGAKIENIVRYPFTSLRREDISKKPINNPQKDEFRKILGMKEKKIILSVGRFVYTKGFDVLLKAIKDLNQDIGVYIVGGYATDDYIQIKKELQLDNVYFINHKDKIELKKYFKAADIFVLPTRYDPWGLVINEAMAVGLPIITTNKCVAGLELVLEGENGYIVPVDDSKELSKKILKLIDNENLLEKLSRNNLKKINEYTIESMVQKHIETFKEILNGSK